MAADWGAGAAVSDGLESWVPSAAAAPQWGESNVEAPNNSTVMVLNIPPSISTKDFLAVLDEGGFADTYDFCHIPRNLQTGRNNGYAFVNFRDDAVAQRLKDAWGGQRLFANRKKIKITNARHTGGEACLRIAEKCSRKKSAGFKPVLSL